MSPASTSTLENRSWLDRIGLGEGRLLWVLIVASLAVRVLWWGLAVAHDIPVRGDEFAYHLRALGFQEIIQGLASGEWPATKSWDTAYGEGRWTPLQPLLLALGMVFGGGPIGERAGKREGEVSCDPDRRGRPRNAQPLVR